MERRRFIERVCAVTAVTSTGAAGCVSFGGGESEGGDGTDGGSDGGGDGSGDGSSDGSDGGGDGGMTEADTPTATMAPQGTVAGGARAPYDEWASADTYPGERVLAFSVEAGTG